jgi:release factor glutamine methyltransferase
MQKIKDIRAHLIEKLSAHFPETELRGFYNWILEYLYDYNASQAILNAEKEVEHKDWNRLEEIIAELQAQKPIQQIVGYSWFYGRKFDVNEHVLIPRPETEELVDWILKEQPNNKSILDIGTGSGCIPITLSLEANIEMYSIDISTEALKQAKCNARHLKAAVNFIEADILSKDIDVHLGNYDIIVSNPPYVLESDKELMANNVLENEPHLALFVPDNEALKFYEAIADLACKKLNKEGLLYFEIHEKKGRETIKMLQDKGFSNIKLRKDMQGKDRMVKAVWKL